MTTSTRRAGIHPTQFTPDLIPVMARILRPHLTRGDDLIDPMAGLGWRLAKLCALLDVNPYGVEIEPGYGRHRHRCVIEGNAMALPYPDGRFKGAVTSPPYPNGVSDDWIAREGSERHTYAHRLRSYVGADYRLHPGNLGGYSPRRSPEALAHFYRDLERIIVELRRVLAVDAPLIWNCKDTVHEPFTERCIEMIARSGFTVVETVRVPARGIRQGSTDSRDRRAVTEDLILALAA